uniref:DDE-1 domain-containing protein n=1 Tax=Amphimedon queenslandica TaxID=400682 RepID=A0A1X7TW17_AMPQE
SEKEESKRKMTKAMQMEIDHLRSSLQSKTEWQAQEEKLTQLKKADKSKHKWLDGAGRKVLDVEMEEQLFHWIAGLRERNIRVSRSMIMRQATAASSNDSFKASTAAACISKLVDFIIHLRKLQLSQKYSLNCIFAMDETACWFDMPGDTTIHHTGARSVPVKSTGHEKDHYTVVLTAKADGTKLKPFVVFKGQGTLSFSNRLMILDAYCCHISDAVKEECSRLKLETAIIPGGCTRYIKAADV